MAGKLQQFQAMAFRGWASTITKANHLGSMLQRAPQQASPHLIELLAVNYGKNLDIFLSQFGTKTFETDNDYTWDLIGSARSNVALKEARDEGGNPITAASTGMVGAGRATFELVFEKPWFFKGEIIVGELNEAYPIRVLDDAKFEGTDAVYTVEMSGTNMKGIPVEELLPGKKFSYEFAPVSRGLSRKVGGVRHTTPASMRNEFSTIRITDKLSGDLFDEKIAMAIPMVNSDGKLTTSTAWMHIEDWEIEKTWSEYKANLLAYARSNRNSNGEYIGFDFSGEVLKIGDGIYPQLEVANTQYYNHFSLGIVEDVLYDLTENKLGFGERTFVLKTGQQGAIKFHKAVKDETSGWLNMMTINADGIGAISKTSSPLHRNALKAGYQFTEWMAPNGITVKVDVDPMYDDRVRNKILLDGKPAQSSRFDIWDIGTSKEQNICKVEARNKPESRGYLWGLRNPFNGTNDNPYMSHDEDSAEVHKMATLGALVYDPTRTVSLIPAVLQA
jgi:hypothetical protein